MNTWDVYKGLELLTKTVSSNPPVLALVASGGAAGSGASVVTESQAYALFVTGVVLASWETHATPLGKTDADRDKVINAFHGYFNGWKAMCKSSNGGASCQNQQWCDSNVCLPHWKHKADFSSPEGTGAAPDGDEDAIVGMIFAVKAIANEKNKPSWYNEVRRWTDASIASFMEYNTIGGDADHRLLKLGSCWGGWGSSGQNPSYHSPGSFKMMRDYHLEFPAEERSYPSYEEKEWNKLISTSYSLLFGVQCPSEGMVPNWASVKATNNGGITSDGGSFSGSGTSQYEFGAEASRTIWRVALDAAVYPEQMGVDAAPFLEPILDQLRKDGGAWKEDTFGTCKAPNMRNSIYKFSGGWVHNSFIYAPVVSSLIVPSPAMSKTGQQQLVDDAGTFLAQNLDSSYYQRCWTLLGNLVLNGALASASSVLGYDTPIAPTSPKPSAPTFAPVPTSPAPTPTAPVPMPTSSSGGCCAMDFKDCIGYCGTTKQECEACDNGPRWLPNGPLSGCLPRWGDCTQDGGGCCEGLKCVFQDQYYSQCQPA